ncbi:DUF6894 family protein [Tardiphaga sp. 709]|uniref:DUF6894 family protein n=1 Tax=Tardiphaga sp. 709 TaxID=3076039 RepID=UPI0028E53B62|nr:hypothetical protein [Tardiphaga sp. 709]WNV12776.1 hypothetical protein RSO67_30305 [Tardiphaga sp. 709]
MPDFYFKIGGGFSNIDHVGPIDVIDKLAAREEAASVLADFARDIAIKLTVIPEWSIEVLDEFGKPIFRIRVIAEILGAERGRLHI